MESVLSLAELGDFDSVIPLENPDSYSMQQAIEALFVRRSENDLVLLFFSGHGFKDSNNKLYLGTRNACRNEQGELLKSSVVSAGFIYNLMNRCCSKRQVVILDCCFSGAFPKGLIAKDDSSIGIKNQLGGRGRVILSSSSSTQISLGEKSLELSPYTRYLIEAIYVGKASVNELHRYAKQKLQARFPSLRPEIYAEREGLNIIISKALDYSENKVFKMNLDAENGAIIVQKPRSKRIYENFKLDIKAIIILLLMALILSPRWLCQTLHNKWFAGGPANAWLRVRYNTANAEYAPEKRFCELIGIPIDRSK